MSYLFDGSNDKLTGTFTGSYQDPITLALWVKVTAHPAAIDALVFLGANAASTIDSYALRTESTDDLWACRSEDVAGVGNVATVSALADGAWTPIIGRVTTDGLRDIFVGSSTTTGTSGATRTVANALKYISVGENLAGGADFAGRIAEVSIWNKALTTGEIDRYCRGEPPSGIAAANLVGYWALSADNATQANEGTDAGGDLTVTGAVHDADHPSLSSPGGASLVTLDDWLSDFIHLRM